MTVSPHNISRKQSLLILGIGALLLLWNLGYAPFWNPDEGRYAAASLEMARGFNGQAPDWVVPHLNTMPRLNKPPLVYWLGAGNFNIFGASEWAGRLGSAFAAIGVMILVWSLARRVWGERCGLFAAMIWTTSFFSFGMARVMNTDMLLCATITLGCYGLWHAVEYSNGNDKPFRFATSFLLAGVGMGLALLAKGPVGLVFPLLITFVFLLMSRRWNVLRSAPAWAGIGAALLVAFAIALPWYLAVHARDPQFLQKFLLGENVARFSGQNNFHDPTPFYFYLPTIIGGLLPWTPLLFAAFFPARNASTLQHRSTIFLWVWAALVVGLFSASSTKLISYVLPAFPAFAILLAATLHRVLESQWTRRFLPASLVFVNALLIVLSVFASFEKKRLLDKLVPREIAVPYLLMGALILVVATAAAWIFWNKERVGRFVTAHFIGYSLFYVVLLGLIGRVAPYEDSSAMVKAIAPYLSKRDKVVQYTFQPTAIFYLARPQTIVGFKNTSGLPDEIISQSPLFPTPNRLAEMPPEESARDPKYIALRRRMTNLMPRYLAEGATILLRRKEIEMYLPVTEEAKRKLIIAENGDFVLISENKPTGYKFHAVPPGKEKPKQTNTR